MKGLYITYPRGTHRCFVFDRYLKFFQDFKKSKPKRSKRLYLCLSPPETTGKPARFGVGPCKFIKVLAYGQCFKGKIFNYKKNGVGTPIFCQHSQYGIKETVNIGSRDKEKV